jgi:hypothetical protein
LKEEGEICQGLKEDGEVRQEKMEKLAYQWFEPRVKSNVKMGAIEERIWIFMFNMAQGCGHQWLTNHPKHEHL